MQDHARVVVIGGGVTGCSVLYHLARMGWTDTLLLERQELTSGSSWHAAGNLFALTSPSSVQRLQRYTIELYPELERESGQPVGYHPTGGAHVALSDEQVKTLAIARAQARRNGVEAEFIDLAEARRRVPILETKHLKAVLWEPTKGHVDPASATQAYAAAARRLGASIRRHSPVIATNPRPDGGWEVVTATGTLIADHLVNAAGLWAREVAAMAGIRLPLAPVEHHYLVTETIPEIADAGFEVPGVGAAEANIYSRQEGQGMLLGAYESPCVHWALDGTPPDFGHELLPDDLSRMSVNFARAIEIMPCLESAGVKRVINGPMIFSPDLAPLLGPHPDLRNYFCACGVMTGFNQGGGIGKVLAEWIVEGEPSLDINCWDVARFGDWAGKRFTRERTRYFYEHRQDRVYPGQEFAAGRPVRSVPIYDRLKAAGAVFGFNYGWEVPLWYARPGETAADRYAYERGNWFDSVGEECRAVRAGVGLFEVSAFANYLVEGPGAADWLDRMLAGRVPRSAGKLALSPMLSATGRLIGDFTVGCLGPSRYQLFGAGGMQGLHMRWFRAHLPDRGVRLVNLSSDWTGLMIAGPNARTLLARIAEDEVSGNAFPFLSARNMELDGAGEAVVLRVSFTGELGYEIHTPSMYQRGLYEAVLRAGADLGLRHAGSRALMSLRLEKSFPSWGLELSPDYSVMEPGLDRFTRFDKGAFIGRDGALAARAAGAPERIATFVVDADGADCAGGEPIFRDGDYVGYVSSGGFGHTVGESLALGFVRPHAHEEGAGVEIEIVGRRRPARLVTTPRFDPTGARMRA